MNSLHQLSDELSIKPGQKLCYDCFNAFCSPVYSSHSDTTLEIRDELDIDKAYTDRNVDIETLNEGLAKLGVSPLNYKRISKRDIIGYGERKIKQVQLSVNEDISHLGYNIAEGILSPAPQVPCDKCKDMDEIINAIKEKIKISSKDQSIQLLTLAPSSWSIEKTKSVFGVTDG